MEKWAKTYDKRQKIIHRIKITHEHEDNQTTLEMKIKTTEKMEEKNA